MGGVEIRRSHCVGKQAAQWEETEEVEGAALSQSRDTLGVKLDWRPTQTPAAAAAATGCSSAVMVTVPADVASSP